MKEVGEVIAAYKNKRLLLVNIALDFETVQSVSISE